MLTFENVCTRRLTRTNTALGLLIMLYKGQTIKDRITTPGVLFPVPKVFAPKTRRKPEAYASKNLAIVVFCF